METSTKPKTEPKAKEAGKVEKPKQVGPVIQDKDLVQQLARLKIGASVIV